VQREADLAGDRLGQQNVARRPRPRLAAVQAEDPDHPVEDDHRRRQRGAGPEARQRLDAA
jgi:hypothetical protein